jgi:hypothetical protein
MANKTSLNRFLPVALILALVLGLSYRSFSSQSAATPTLHGDAAHPPKTQGWVDTQLYFGLGPADAPEKGVNEATWRDFLDKEVSTRFPAGLSVVDVYGQWQGKDEKAPERIRSKMLIIDYPGTSENDQRIEAIRAAWKQKTGDQSVMKVTRRADVSF